MTVNHMLPDRIGDPEHAPTWKLTRDAQTLFQKIPVVEHRSIEAFYKEPMTMGALQEEPFCIELVRIQNLFAPETPVTACTGFLNFVWKPQNGGAQIQNIGGLSVASNGKTKFRFFYRITYRMS